MAITIVVIILIVFLAALFVSTSKKRDHVATGLPKEEEQKDTSNPTLPKESQSLVEREVEAAPVTERNDGPSRTKQIVDLCQESNLLWDPETKSYPNGDTRAKAIANEIEKIRVSLSKDIYERLTDYDCTLLRIPKIDRQQFKSGQWRSYSWIDLLYKEDTDGYPIDYDFTAQSDKGAHLFRIWFTAKGVGIGIRPGARKTHLTRAQLIKELPEKYFDREPLNSHKHESNHELYLKGRPGQINQYFATWTANGFETDEAFLEATSRSWLEIGPILNRYRC